MDFSKKLTKLIKPYITSLNLLIAFFIVGLILVLVVVFSGKKLDLGISQREIKLKDENTSLTVKEGGVSEIETPQKIFQQQWDKDKTENILDFFKKKAKTAGFDDFSLALVEEKGDSYQITFLLNGQEVTIYIEKDSEEINDIFELINELTDTEGAESLSDYFDSIEDGGDDGGWPSDTGDDEGDDGGGTGGDSGSSIDDCPFWRLNYCVYPPGWGGSPSPNPSSSPSPSPGVQPSPSPSPPPVMDEQIQEAADCTVWDSLVTTKAIISNTFCVRQEEK